MHMGQHSTQRTRKQRNGKQEKGISKKGRNLKGRKQSQRKKRISKLTHVQHAQPDTARLLAARLFTHLPRDRQESAEGLVLHWESSLGMGNTPRTNVPC